MKRLLKFGFVVLFFWMSITCIAQKKDSISIIKHLINTNQLTADQKLKFLNRLCANDWENNADSSLYYGWLGLPLLKEKVMPRNAGYLFFVLGMAWENKGNLDSTHWYLNRALKTFDECGDQRVYYRAIEQIISAFRIQGRYDTAIALMKLSVEYFRTNGKKVDLSSSLFNTGSIYREQSRYNKALQYYLESAESDPAMQDTSVLAINSLGIGNVYLNLAGLFRNIDPEKSKQYYANAWHSIFQAYQMFRRIRHQTGSCFACSGLLCILVSKEQFTRADSLLASGSPCLSFGDPRVRMSFLFSEAQILYHHKQLEEALKKLGEVAAMKGKMVILPEFHEAMVFLGKLLREQGQGDSAYRLLQKSIQWACSKSNYQIASRALNDKAAWFFDDGRPVEAYKIHLQASLYNDSLQGEIGKELFDELEMKFRNQVLQAQVAQLKAETGLQKSRTLIVSLIATGILLFLIILLISLYFRNRQNHQKRLQAEQEKQLKESALEKIILEKKIQEEDLERLKLEIDVREQDLVYQTLLRTDLAKVNTSVQEKLLPFWLKLSRKKDQEEFMQTIQEIARETAAEPLADFEVMFSQMHGNLFEKLLDISPTLTKSELMVAAMIRLNLSSKDIARLISLSPSTIETTRHHIRQKLSLEQKESLTTFLIRF